MDLPTFVIGEYMFMAGALITLAHARAHGRLHLLTWVSALARIPTPPSFPAI